MQGFRNFAKGLGGAVLRSGDGELGIQTAHQQFVT